jgi:hypothetical protein
MAVIDFTLKHVENLQHACRQALDVANYPATEAAMATLVSVGIRSLRDMGVPVPDILLLVTMLVADEPSPTEKKT